MVPNASLEELENCAVCLQPCLHPVKLNCNHIFCFLCVKGVALQSKRCPMCRREIPREYFDNPNLLKPLEPQPKKEEQDDDHEEDEAEAEAGDDDREAEAREEEIGWYYEGRNGWWRYDERTSSELESFHKKGAKGCEMLIAGSIYFIDLENMIQCRRNEPNRRRRIKRDVADIPSKGVAGILYKGKDVAEDAAAAVASDSAIRKLGEQMVRDLTIQGEQESAAALSRSRIGVSDSDSSRPNNNDTSSSARQRSSE